MAGMAVRSMLKCSRAMKVFSANSVVFRHGIAQFPGAQHCCFFSSAVSQEAAGGPPSKEELAADKVLRLEIENLNKELQSLTEKNKDIDDKYKRALAEGENMRKRLTKQIEDAKIFGIQSFCKDLLEVADILGKATESVPKEQLEEGNLYLKSLFEGLTMTEAQLHQVFRRHGLEQINPVGESFDPNRHEALFQQVVEGKEAGTVINVSKVGYKLRERVIRPALVGVAKDP